MLVSVYCFCIFIEKLIDNKLICESKPLILSVVIVLLTIVILLLLYFLSQKFCLWELIKLIQVFARQNDSSILYKTVKSYETPLSVEL